MPALQTFVWPEEWRLMSGTVAALHESCSRLKAIHYYGHSDRVELFRLRTDSSPATLYNFSGFANLHQLTLSQLRGDLAWWKGNVVHILRHSPGLRSLELSISAKSIRSRRNYDTNFFDQLCGGYAAVGGLPLCLQSLRCGQGVFPMSHASLAKLTDVSHLEEVHIFNHQEYWGQDDVQLYPSEQSRSGIVFNAFWPQHCPNLRRFSVSIYQLDVHEFLCAWAVDPSFSRRLAFCVDDLRHLGYGDPSLLFRPNSGHPGRHPGLPIKLRMLGLDLDRDTIFRSVPDLDEEYWREEVLGDIVASNTESLEGLMICTPMHQDDDSYSIGLNTELTRFYDLDVLQEVIGRFHHLKQLSVNGHRPLPDSDWGPPTPEAILDAAKKLAGAAPGLMYINIYERF
ncbi:hypothetical protein C8A01DRAFT_40557 [Parachaetomium inaequale]|uniref:Uncharacterized protein n=1 Tax=Parachaetomium inaequale TaxID=2588326 RepID=A0AAN6PBL5_9PEZI|nr:hypothetical protein C8A01DRAFT_40557 [Parachaetomium inaequale]